MGAGHWRNGTTVEFFPDDSTAVVPAGGSVTFTFRLGGLLPGEPAGCAVDGRPCG
jgi:hypothetical protein